MIPNPIMSLRPNTVTIDRKVASGTIDAAGEQIAGAPFVVVVGMPTHIDQANVSSTAAGAYKITAEGNQSFSTHVMFLDGVVAGMLPAGTLPGQIVTLRGVPYRLSMNGRAGLLDVRLGDRVTDEEGAVYLVKSIVAFYIISPHLEIGLDLGAAWT